jgi:hypothetical protein
MRARYILLHKASCYIRISSVVQTFPISDDLKTLQNQEFAPINFLLIAINKTLKVLFVFCFVSYVVSCCSLFSFKYEIVVINELVLDSALRGY